MRRLSTTSLFLAAALCFIATSFVTAQQTMQLPPRPGPMGGPGRDGPPTMPTGTALVSGSITSVEGGRPMRRASVRLQMTSSPVSKTTTTDDRGFFEFKDLPAGDFTLRANKPGYLEAIYGQKKPGSGRPGTPLSLKDGQHLEKLTLSIPKGGVLTGTIVDDVGEPAFGVQVRAMRYAYRNGEKTLVNAGTTSTDDRGIYRIPTLVPGDYVVMATPIEDLSANGDEMKALKEAMAVQGAARGANMAFTADVSRFGGASDEPAPSSGFAPVFFPSTTLAVSASTVTLGPAEEKAGIDIQLQIVPLGTITGMVVGDPRAVQSTSIELSDSNTGLPGLSAKMARPGPDGRFTFNGVAPGTYTLTAKSGGATFVTMDNSGGQVRVMMMTQKIVGGPGGANGAGGPPAPPMWAKTDASVEGRTKNEVTLVLQNGMNVDGHIAFDGTGETPTDFSQMRVLLASTSQGGVMSGSSFAQVDAEGHFKVTDVMPGRYRMTVTAPRGWRAKSIDVEGRDALDFMLDVKANNDVNGAIVTFTNRPAELTGMLQDASGQATSDYTIVLFPAEQKYWTPQSRRILSTRPSTDGKYSFRDLPAGDYKLVALDDAEPDSWFDPNVLRQMLTGSMSVTIVHGEKKTQDLKVNK
jgi:hypothetical protein